MKGYREVPSPAFHAIDGDSIIARDEGSERIRPREISDLVALGRILGEMTFRKDFIDQQYTDNTLELSLRSFNSVFDRIQWQDRVVDIAVVLEALFAGDGEELTYKASIRTAMLQGRSEADADRIFQALKRFYNLRSKIVHAEPGGVGRAAQMVVQDWLGGKRALKASDAVHP